MSAMLKVYVLAGSCWSKVGLVGYRSCFALCQLAFDAAKHLEWLTAAYSYTAVVLSRWLVSWCSESVVPLLQMFEV